MSEAAREEKSQNESWSRGQTLNDKRINSDCATESVTVQGLLFPPRGEPGTELSTILTMYLKREKPLNESSREFVLKCLSALLKQTLGWRSVEHFSCVESTYFICFYLAVLCVSFKETPLFTCLTLFTIISEIYPILIQFVSFR